jgi:adhesin transport system membrane fusion protein
MLNISLNSIQNRVPDEDYTSLQANHLSKSHQTIARWIVGIIIFTFCLLFFPWTQNIQSKGKITTLLPQHRPQTVQANIDGRIEMWYVQEGQTVKKGDTIAFISEIKTEYGDPQLLPRTESQIAAKESSKGAYKGKAEALAVQAGALAQERDFKITQLKNKVKQVRLKIISDSIALEQAHIDFQIADRQLKRAQELYEKGIKSLADVEDKKQKYQSTVTKVTEVQNKLDISRNELDIATIDLSSIRASYDQKIAKAQSERFSALSSGFEAQSTIDKLKIQASNYSTRQGFYYITAPQDGYIVQTLKAGLGETVKAGTELASIMPFDAQLAVELYIKPMDLPLVYPGQEVRFIFDGWPAFIFSGWPSQSFGTYSGDVFAVDRVISDNGKYRILVAADTEEKPWPEALQIGGGAQGIALLERVPLWYELWRQLNGFPPDFYRPEVVETPKMKAPIKSVK